MIFIYSDILLLYIVKIINMTSQINSVLPPYSGNTMEWEQNVREYTSNMMQNRTGKLYTIICAGMGCQWYAKRDNAIAEIQLFFMHNDDWNSETEISKLNKFCKGYEKIINYI